jgi:hypothetical protein
MFFKIAKFLKSLHFPILLHYYKTIELVGLEKIEEMSLLAVLLVPYNFLCIYISVQTAKALIFLHSSVDKNNERSFTTRCDCVIFKGTATGDFSNLYLTWS